jgi:predicted metal-dependent peptidase
VLIIRHTTDIVDVQELTYGQQPEDREKRAHGGTYFNPVIDMIEDEMVEVCCWVTDCYPCDVVRETQVPIIWLGTEHGSEYAHKTYDLQGDYVSIA